MKSILIIKVTHILYQLGKNSSHFQSKFNHLYALQREVIACYYDLLNQTIFS